VHGAHGAAGGAGRAGAGAPVAIALTSAGAVIEVLASRDGATWTLITTAPTGIACIAQTGEYWQPLAPAETGQRS